MSFDFIAERLAQQTSQARYRKRVCVENMDGQHIVIDGKSYVNFSSNDYLGLNQYPEIAAAFQKGIDQGLCSTGSNLITGFHQAHRALEDEICTWLNQPACLLFTSGFAANQGVLTALGEKNTGYFLDKLSHASLIDGAYCSNAETKRFIHNDMVSLSKLLTRSTCTNKLIVSEGVFSMDGDSAPIPELKKLAQKFHAWLYLDDAHSIGVLGDKGQGSSQYNDIDIVMATFGKAIATSGAFVACQQEVKEYLLNVARHYIYTTAMSPALAQATLQSIKIIQKDNWRREKIAELSQAFINALDCDIELIPNNSSIHALVIGDEKLTLDVANQLKNDGFWLTAIRPPTVPVNTSRLRVTICANHSLNDINGLANKINRIIN